MFRKKPEFELLGHADAPSKEDRAHGAAIGVDENHAVAAEMERHVPIAAHEAGDLVRPGGKRAGAGAGPDIGYRKRHEHADDRQGKHDFHEREAAIAVTLVASAGRLNRC